MVYRQTKAVEARLLDNRTRILKAARDLVSEGGWSAAQIASVAAAAGMATGNVYRYFASKADLYSEVLSNVSQREVDVLQAIASSSTSPIDRLRGAVSTFVQRAMHNPRLAYALIAEPCERAIDEVRLKYRAAISEVILSIIAEGQDIGMMRKDIPAEIAATFIVGGFMEGLIGPLSPLNTDMPDSAEDRKQATSHLATSIATLACSSLVASDAAVQAVTRATA
ncbi:TetR/AcrR family transcriptional regulator [Burkholderia gladioli pv. gladioli]|uniref:TetR/AcrR family transcriptional regulator n=1 Tax=Burkholderia gladioli TaxID=28095 RepID=UPI0024BC4D7E|nr:TetR/AcrR family transcriptional regulator [Burkholderia gladioli]MDJ1163935.1 TetR/AcrR family transcriptional regulator [Burkholderia gladioli pv. gladioli]